MMLRPIYIGWNLSTLAILVLYIAYAAKKKGAIAKNTLLISIFIFFRIAAYLATLYVTNINAATILYGIYNALDVFVLYEILQFVLNLTGAVWNQNKKYFFKYIFYALAALDVTNLVVNIFTHHAFILKPFIVSPKSLYRWEFYALPPFYFHLFLNSFLSLQNIASLFLRAFRMPRFYRKKYLILGFLFIVIAAASVITYKGNLGFDIAICLYIFVATYGFYLAFFGMERSLLETMLSLVSENINYGVICFDEKEKCFYMNRKANTVFGYGRNRYQTAEGYVNKLKYFYPKEAENFLHISQEFSSEGVSYKYECELKVLRDKRGRKILSYLKLEDITEQLQRLEQEKYRTEHDALTGLYNRKAFFEYATEILHAHTDESFYLIATDLMDFKIVNNLFGEEVGNEILKLLAKKISAHVHPNTICGRISGDKFAVLIPKTFFDKEAVLRDNSELQKTVQKYNFKIQNYTGVYEISDHYENVKTMYDKAMLAIKTMSGNMERALAFYDMPLMEKILREKNIASSFDSALANGEFAMYLHPQVDAKTSRVLGAEALVRWVTRDKGVVSPGVFLPILERSGMIHKLDQYMWEQAAKKLAEWKAVGNDMYISINISPKDFYYCNVSEYLMGLVQKYEINPQKLNIEITETVLMQNLSSNKNILQILHEYGFTIEMDDFGSGYSSLNTLKNLEMDILKIDMEFLKDWNQNKKSRDIISAIVAMAKALGMTVISEGVENEEQVAFLKEIDCDIFQGYYFAKPCPVEEFEKKYVKKEGGKDE